ncbi:MAG: DinB family protein, partial [Paenisporosarcina sp.]|nr:DinB family protein [Paenisporosarcina sp.]
MYHTIEEFLADWSYESTSTQKLMDLLTDQSLQVRVSEGERKLGFLAWHIVISIHEMMSRVGLEFDAAHDEESVPVSAHALAMSYEKASNHFVRAMQSQWVDSDLAMQHDMYGEMWSNSKTLAILVKHQ